MANQFVSGWATAIKYDFETSFGTGGTATYAFGWGTKLTANKINNIERVYGLGSRNSQYTIAKKFEGKLTIDFVLGNAYWLRAVLGAQGAAGGVGPYTHAFTEANNPPSMQIVVGTDLGDTDMVTTYTGVVISSAKLTMAVNEPVRVTLDCFYKTESTATSGTFTGPTDTYADPMTFAMGTVTYAGQAMGNTYSGQVQSAELTINNNTELIWGLGSRLGQERINKAREYNFRMTYALLSVSSSADVFENVLGDTSAPLIPATGNITGVTLVLTLDNGLATSYTRSLVFTFTSSKTFLNSSNMVFDVNELLKDDVEGWAESISTCVYTDNTNSGIGA
jgi:hypothetical protein